MLKKFVFILLISGVILSPKGAYSMDDETTLPPSSLQRMSPRALEERLLTSPIAPGERLLMKGMGEDLLLQGPAEHLSLQGGNWVNEEGTIALPATTKQAPGMFGPFRPFAFESGEKSSLMNLTSKNNIFTTTTLVPSFLPEDQVINHPGTWMGVITYL